MRQLPADIPPSNKAARPAGGPSRRQDHREAGRARTQADRLPQGRENSTSLTPQRFRRAAVALRTTSPPPVIKRGMIMDTQPWIDEWPMWDEPLSKVNAALDIAAARERLARKFNRKPVRLAKAIEIERAWEQHRRVMHD